MKILLAEDDINLGKLLSMLLKKQNITVNWVQDGESAYSVVYADGYDALVLDWMMPRLSGLDLCKRLREEDYQGKILLLTAKDTLADKVQGLNSGADDYLVKPFELEELVARLHALCRRQGQYSADNLRYGAYTLESSTYCLAYGAVLQERTWGIDSDVTENNLDVHIRLIRKKLMELNGEELIKTMRGVGYYVE